MAETDRAAPRTVDIRDCEILYHVALSVAESHETQMHDTTQAAVRIINEKVPPSENRGNLRLIVCLVRLPNG
jgi:hypothetical protein